MKTKSTRSKLNLDEARPAEVKDLAKRAIERLDEAGRVLSAANEEKLVSARDAIQAVLDTLDGGSDAGEGQDEEATEAKRVEARRLAEAWSGSAWDASTGAWLLASLIELMGTESDEPEQFAMLKQAFDSLSAWITAEVAEIGEPDEDDEPELIFDWESNKPRGIREAVAGDIVPLREGAVRSDGTVRMKIIQPGWGSSGYYAPELLERDGPKVFTAGTKNFWDHPTLTEEVERPERSLRDLAGELVSDAVYEEDGAEGPGLYADAKAISDFAPAINELAPFIGVSIRALGSAHYGEAEGRKGQIIDRLIAAESVDYVTTPGAGGQVLQLFEAARRRQPVSTPEKEVKEADDMEIREALDKERQLREATEQENARLKEAALIREAGDLVARQLAQVEDMPEITRNRLTEAIRRNPPVKDGAIDTEALTVQVEAAVKAEAEYLAEATGSGRIRGFGGSSVDQSAEIERELEATFGGLGLSEAAAKLAVRGR